MSQGANCSVNFPMSINQIELLNGSNFQKWKGDIELNLGILEYDHVLREDAPEAPAINASKEIRDKYVQWHRHNKLALICMKKSMADSVKGGIPDSEYAKVFFNSIAEKYKMSDKAETGSLMESLVKMKYNGGSVREYILKGSDIARKLRNLKMNTDFGSNVSSFVPLWQKLWKAKVPENVASMFGELQIISFLQRSL